LRKAARQKAATGNVDIHWQEQRFKAGSVFVRAALETFAARTGEHIHVISSAMVQTVNSILRQCPLNYYEIDGDASESSAAASFGTGSICNKF
jgi:hypothetical protein